MYIYIYIYIYNLKFEIRRSFLSFCPFGSGLLILIWGFSWKRLGFKEVQEGE